MTHLPTAVIEVPFGTYDGGPNLLAVRDFLGRLGNALGVQLRYDDGLGRDEIAGRFTYGRLEFRFRHAEEIGNDLAANDFVYSVVVFHSPDEPRGLSYWLKALKATAAVEAAVRTVTDRPFKAQFRTRPC